MKRVLFCLRFVDQRSMKAENLLSFSELVLIRGHIDQSMIIIEVRID